jgi:hypothetical protein
MCFGTKNRTFFQRLGQTPNIRLTQIRVTNPNVQLKQPQQNKVG